MTYIFRIVSTIAKGVGTATNRQAQQAPAKMGKSVKGAFGKLKRVFSRANQDSSPSIVNKHDFTHIKPLPRSKISLSEDLLQNDSSSINSLPLTDTSLDTETYYIANADIGSDDEEFDQYQSFTKRQVTEKLTHVKDLISFFENIAEESKENFPNESLYVEVHKSGSNSGKSSLVETMDSEPVYQSIDEVLEQLNNERIELEGHTGTDELI